MQETNTHIDYWKEHKVTEASFVNSDSNYDDPLAGSKWQFEGDDIPILATKLYRPRVTPDMMPRDHLMQRLEGSRYRPLTLISAPPGYGKTVLASSWVEASGRPCAWLSLEETEDDLRIFMAYLLAALKGAFPRLTWKTEMILHAPVLPPYATVARMLLLDLQQIETPSFIVIDDLHLICELQIYDLLRAYLRNPPQSVHLVLISRVDPSLPIATMRARGQVTEIRARDLRFNSEEAGLLLSRLLNRPVDKATADNWVQSTEGWAAALRLAALSLRHRGAADNLKIKFSGDSRYLKEYLLSEVLGKLPPGMQDCLLKISILDRLCDPLVAALCLPDGDTSPTETSPRGLLQWAQANNLFLVPLDDQHEWFRFHHLFQYLLYDRLSTTFAKAKVAVLHLRAASWFEDQLLLDEALQHALAANDIEAAMKVVVRHRHRLMNNEQWYRLDRWLAAFPGDVVANNPLLTVTKGQLGLFTGQDTEIINAPKEAERLLATHGEDIETRDAVTGEIAMLQSIRDMALGQPVSAIANAQLSLQLLPQCALYCRSFAIGMNALSLQSMGDLSRGVEMVRQALADPDWPDNIKVRLWLFLAIAFSMEGHLEQVISATNEFLRISTRLKLPASTSYGRYFLGVSHYLRDEFDKAETHLAALHADRAISAPSYAAAGTIALALIHMFRGNIDEAERVTGQMQAHLHNLNDTFAQVLIEAFRVELALSKGHMAESRRLSHGVNFDYRPPIWYFYTPQLVPIKLLIAEGSLAKALAQLDALDAQMLPLSRNNVRIDILVLQALLYDRLGQEPAAFKKISEALALAAVGENVRYFVNLGQPMAALLGRVQRQKEADQTHLLSFVKRILASFLPDNPLTDRELEILTLLASDLPSQAIWDQLVISKTTFYTHTKRIYKKLEAHSRFEAVQRAKERNLL